MGDECKESLVNYLSDMPSSKTEIERLVADNILSKEEAAVLNMRIAVQKLEHQMDSVVEKADSWLGECDGRL